MINTDADKGTDPGGTMKILPMTVTLASIVATVTLTGCGPSEGQSAAPAATTSSAVTQASPKTSTDTASAATSTSTSAGSKSQGASAALSSSSPASKGVTTPKSQAPKASSKTPVTPTTKPAPKVSTSSTPPVAVQMGGQCGKVNGYMIQASSDVSCPFALKAATLMHEGTYTLNVWSDKAGRNIALDCWEGASGNLVCDTPSGGSIEAQVRY